MLIWKYARGIAIWIDQNVHDIKKRISAKQTAVADHQELRLSSCFWKRNSKTQIFNLLGLASSRSLRVRTGRIEHNHLVPHIKSYWLSWKARYAQSDADAMSSSDWSLTGNLDMHFYLDFAWCDFHFFFFSSSFYAQYFNELQLVKMCSNNWIKRSTGNVLIKVFINDIVGDLFSFNYL